MNSSMNTSPLSNEKEKKRGKKNANGISCMNPYPMKMKKRKMNFKYEQWKFTSEEMQSNLNLKYL